MEDLTPHRVDAPPCTCCPRSSLVCPYLGNHPAIAAVARRGSCPFNPPTGDVKKAVFEDPLKKSKKAAKGMKK